MNKLRVQARVLQNGRPLDLYKFTWDEATETFASREDYLVIDFYGINCCTLNTGSYCTITTGFGCTIITGNSCTINTRSDCTFNTGYKCVVVRRDIYQVIELIGGETITLNGHDIKGYGVITKPKNYTVELTKEQMYKLNLQLGD